jgi:hypothetical protein
MNTDSHIFRFKPGLIGLARRRAAAATLASFDDWLRCFNTAGVGPDARGFALY